MRTSLRLSLCLCCLVLLAGCATSLPQSTPTPQKLEFRVGFSPKGDSLNVVLTAIHDAQSSLWLAAYALTSQPVADAIIAAHQRGVAVRVLADRRSNAKDPRSVVTPLALAGVPVRLNGRYAIFHHKFIVVDGQSLETGSFNFSANAVSRNAENVLWLPNVPQLAQQYAAEFERLWREAENYVPEKH